MNTKLGVWLVSLGSVAAGVADLVWGEFEADHQPIQAWGDHVPGRTILAYITAVCLIGGGLALLRRRSEKAGAAVLAVVYFMFTVFWLPRFVTAPTILGYHANVYLGVLAGPGTQIIVVAGCALLYNPSPTMVNIARWVFGLSAISFGLAHLTNVESNAGLVPTWMPLGGNFWTVLTGIAFVLAGVAILTRVQDVLASRLLALMLLTFSAIALAPLIFAAPHDHTSWGGNAYNLAAVGAVWIYAQQIGQLDPHARAALG